MDNEDVYGIPLDEADSDVDEQDDPEFIEACRILSEGLTEEKINSVLLRMNSMRSALKLLDEQYARRKKSMTSVLDKYVKWYGPEISKYLDANLAILNAGKRREVKSLDTEFFRLKKVSRKETYGVLDDEKASAYFLGEGKPLLEDYCAKNNLSDPYKVVVSKSAINRFGASIEDKDSIPGYGKVEGSDSYYAEIGDKSIKIGEKKVDNE